MHSTPKGMTASNPLQSSQSTPQAQPQSQSLSQSSQQQQQYGVGRPSLDRGAGSAGRPSIDRSVGRPSLDRSAGRPSIDRSAGRPSIDRDGSGLQPPPSLASRNNQSSASLVSFAPRGPSSYNPNVTSGSFSSELRSQMMMPGRAASRIDVSAYSGTATNNKMEDNGGESALEQTITSLKDRLNREMKIKEGSENMLEALLTKKAKQTKEQRIRVEAELSASTLRIKELRQRILDIQQARNPPPSTPTRNRIQDIIPQSNPLRSPHSAARSLAESEGDDAMESPTFALTELLQALEVEGLTPDYYVKRANDLVELFKRHQTLKYDLVWSIFGLRMQVMLLSESREVVAAGYRMTRYAISDVSSLKKIRSLNTDYLVIRSLNNYRKADVEREQALKLVRAFLDVKDGVKEVSRAIVRTIVAVAESTEDRRVASQAAEQDVDRLRPMCIETLAEILIRDPRLLLASGGLGTLSEALSDGTYKAPESLMSAFLFLLDTPQKRRYIQSGYGLDAAFTPFTDQLSLRDQNLKQSAKAIARAMNSWSGLMALCMHDFRSIRSLIDSMLPPNPPVRETIMDLFFSLLRIKPPAWATSFLAGRRLTTYGRVANLKSEEGKDRGVGLFVEEDGGEQNFIEHYTALLLAVFTKAGLVQCLLKIVQTEEDATMRRKTTLLLGEVLKLASRLLPPSWSSELQLLPELFSTAAKFGDSSSYVASGLVYQISSVSRTLYRSAPSGSISDTLSSGRIVNDLVSLDDTPKNNPATGTNTVDDPAFRQMLIDTHVLHSGNWRKWNWDTIIKVFDGPLHSGKRLEEAFRTSKFMKRIMSFYRPFKHKFSATQSSKNTVKYIRAGCALMHALLQTAEGRKFLADSKLLRQIAECLAQCDPLSGISAQNLMFSKDQMADTLCSGYFPMLGVLSADPNGLGLLERWRIHSMLYHIIDLKQRPDLIRLFLSNFDYYQLGHPRVLLSKALTGGDKDIRIYATNALRRYLIGQGPHLPGPAGMADTRWAIQLLVTQLYDPDIEVCSTAVKILEKACNRKAHLEYLVECRPSLDHLGEIGAPLLLRFLSTSMGYHHLDGLDYISNEMDDWFLGRNDSYVGVIEASLAKAFVAEAENQNERVSLFEDAEADADFVDSHVPPHFYRELTRTEEGCRLLKDKGHFGEFVATIQEHGMQQTEDLDIMTRLKGCLWAVGNVGSMERGAPFLESSNIVERIIEIAESHPVMSIRGTAFFVLGLISRSTHGLEILSEHGWDANTTPLGNSLGFCLPTDLTRLFSLVPWGHEKVTNITLPDTQRTVQTPPRPREAKPPLEPSEMVPPLMSDSEMNERILELIVDLGNMVLYKKALTELGKIRQRKPSGFKSKGFFKEVMGLMEWNHYRLGVRRMVIDLFDKDVMRQIVFEEEPEEEDQEDEEDNDESEEDEQEEDEDEDEEEEVEDEEELESQLRRRLANMSGASSGDERVERLRSISEPSPADFIGSGDLRPLRRR